MSRGSVVHVSDITPAAKDRGLTEHQKNTSVHHNAINILNNNSIKNLHVFTDEAQPVCTDMSKKVKG